MADKAISELTAAEQVTPTDLFVLDQDGVAKKLPGQILKEWLHSIYQEDIDSLNSVYELDLRDSVVVNVSGEAQEHDITDKVDVDKLINAIETGQTIKVLYGATFTILRYDMSVEMTETINFGSGSWSLGGLGVSIEYNQGSVYDYIYTKLSIDTNSDGTKSCKLIYADSLMKSQVQSYLDVLPTVTAVSVTENADRSVTMVNTLSDGSTETIVVTADADGNPNGLTVNGTAIPLTWTEVTT